MEGTHLGAFVKLAPFLLVVGLPFFCLLGSFGKSFLRFLPNAFLTFFSEPLNPEPQFAEIAKDGMVYAMGAGLGTVLGLISMLSNMEDPSTMGPAMPATFIALLYAVILSEVCFAYLYRSYLVKTVNFRLSRARTPLLAFAGCLLLLTAFFIMVYSMSIVNLQKYKDGMFGESSCVRLGLFETNVGNLNNKRCIRFSPCLVTTNSAGCEVLYRKTYQLHDVILKRVASLTEEQLASGNVLELLKTGIRDDVNQALGENGKVSEVLITDFLIR